jgi:hypothetical protein
MIYLNKSVAYDLATYIPLVLGNTKTSVACVPVKFFSIEALNF